MEYLYIYLYPKKTLRAKYREYTSIYKLFSTKYITLSHRKDLFFFFFLRRVVKLNCFLIFF